MSICEREPECQHDVYPVGCDDATRVRFKLIDTGLTDIPVLTQMGEAFIEWSSYPYAFAAEAWGESVVRKI